MRVRWVKVWVDSLASLTERFRDEEGRVDFEALGREEYAFRHALATGDFSRSERARDLYDATINEITSRSEAGRKGAEVRWSRNTAAATTREGVDVVTTSERCRSERTTGCNPLTADASTREGEDERQHPSDGELLESGTSANNSGEGGTPGIERKSASLPSPSPSKPAKRPHGEFGNVLLTDDEFAKLCEKCQDADALITELDQYIESQGKTKKYKSHYATLLNWDRRRKAQEAEPKQRYKNINDINQENYEKAMREIEAMCAGEAV